MHYENRRKTAFLTLKVSMIIQDSGPEQSDSGKRDVSGSPQNEEGPLARMSADKGSRRLLVFNGSLFGSLEELRLADPRTFCMHFVCSNWRCIRFILFIRSKSQ